MKKVLWIVLGAALLQSCMHDIAKVESEKPIKVQDLKVPVGFDWVTSKNVVCVINTQQVSTLVKLFADKGCKEDLIATVGAEAGVNNKLATSVPDYMETMYALYISASGDETIVSANIIGNTFSFNIPDAQNTTKAITRAPDETNPPVAQNEGVTGYPANFGSVFFEDLYPSLGDYDFNDVVLSYQITLEHPWRYDGKRYDLNKVKRMRIHLKATALGGTLQFTPYVRVVGLNATNISIPDCRYGDQTVANPWIYTDTKEGIKVSKVSSPQTSDAVFEFKNLTGTNSKKPAGATYFNTQKEFPLVRDVANVVVYLDLEAEMNSSDLLDDKIDIFLANADKTKEIHLRGYESVFSKYDYALDENLNHSIPYASKTNLVWAIKTPYVIPHLVERINFCEGYLDFASWAENGGSVNKDWYESNINKGNILKL